MKLKFEKIVTRNFDDKEHPRYIVRDKEGKRGLVIGEIKFLNPYAFFIFSGIFLTAEEMKQTADFMEVLDDEAKRKD